MYIKQFEDYSKDSYWAFEDDYLKIHKILHGTNRGKIQFRTPNKENPYTLNKFSMMYGASVLLDTKYVNLPEIREIEIGRELFRKVATNTMDSIMIEFTKRIDFTDYDNVNDKDGFTIKRLLISSATFKFGDKIKEIALEAKNLGDIFDNLKIVKDEVYEYQTEMYNNFKLELDMKKYNM